MNGIYALFMTFQERTTVKVGALGTLTLDEREYCYIGSAKNGLGNRILRHMKKEKKIHWHIDHLTVVADSIEAYFSEDGEECALRRSAEECGLRPAVKGFGCSDCRCDTHLLVSGEGLKERFAEASGLIRFRDGDDAVTPIR
jgi:Uri superfamily endonuclease